ncbi:hypothetical protein ES705_37127 [subsurface metagenome]
MKVINKTHWNTSDLKRVLVKALNEDDKIEGRYKHRGYLRITIVYSKGWPSWVIKHYQKQNKEIPIRKVYSGNAWVNGTVMGLRVPREKFNVEHFVEVFIHEMSHIRGIRSHRAIGTVKDEDLEWTKEYSVTQKEARVKPKVDLQLKRYNHVIEMIKQKEKILKRLRNQIKKWNAKRRYYERALTAAGKIKGGRER